MKERNSASFGALTLILVGFFCKALGAFFRLPLTNLLGLEGIGQFSLVMALFSFALVLCSGGVTSGLSKLVASAYAKCQVGKVRTYFSHAMTVTVALSFALGVAIASLGKWISSLQGLDAVKTYLLFPALLSLGGALSVFRGVFQGRRNMLPTALSQVVEQVFKFVFGLLFAWIFASYGVEYGVFGAFLGIVVSEAVALLCLWILYVAKFRREHKLTDLQVVRIARKEFNHANLHLMLSALILPLVSALDSLFLVKRLSLSGLSESFATSLFGLQSGVVGTILNFPLVISLSLSTALLPNLSFEISKGASQDSTIEQALKSLFFLILPTTFGLVAIAQPLIHVLYPSIDSSLLEIANLLMLYGGFGIVLTALMQFFAMILQAYGHFRFLLSSFVLGGSLKFFLTFFLSALPSVNIFAIVIGNIALAGCVCVLCVWKLKTLSSFCLSLGEIAIAVIATLAMFFLVEFFLSKEFFSSFVNLFVAVTIGAFAYIFLCTPILVKFFKGR